MNSRDDVEYRLNLAKGFLKEAEQDFKTQRWRSCVAHSQLSVENAGKSILMLFGISSKTHEPAKHLNRLLGSTEIPEQIRDHIQSIIPDFLTLGTEEHFLTDYGDEASYTLPWELYDKESATSALNSARLCTSLSKKTIQQVREWRAKENAYKENADK